MSYRRPFTLFLLAAMAVSDPLGYITAPFGPWATVLVVLVMIPLSIEVGRKALKRDR